MKRIVAWLIAISALGVLCRLLPPFHVVSLQQTWQEAQQTAFDAAMFARNFWDKKLIPAADGTVDIAELLAALAKDPAAARKQFGHSPGLTGTTYFFVRGSGRIVSVERNSVRVALDGTAPPQIVELSTGLLFGNAVRDASGLLNASDFPNSQNFNDISTELNHIVETRIAPALRKLAAGGKTIRFTGCVELEEGATTGTFVVVPVKIDWP